MVSHPLSERIPLAAAGAQVSVDGKFLTAGGGRFLIKGVTYGTFAPDDGGRQFPAADQAAADFAMMSQAGINTVRTYTVPDEALLDEAARHGLRVMAGLPWTQHVAFLDDRRLTKEIRRSVRAQVQSIARHPAILLFALGNEIPARVVRWLGRARVEHFLRELYDEAKAVAPQSLFTYVNYPPTEYLSLSFVDVVSFNVFLHHDPDLRAYIARLHNLAGPKPLLVAEAGADSVREGVDGQARLTAMQLTAAFAEGAAGAIAFAWTDEWWRGGSGIDDWAFGLVDHERRPKAALHAVSQVFAQAPFPEAERLDWPKVTVIVCAYNASSTIGECLDSLEQLTYPHYEVIVVDDGSQDSTAETASRYDRVKLIRVPNGGLSAARNLGLAQASGEVVAYVDADVRVDPDWLTFMIQPFLQSDVVAVGGPNVVPPDDSWVAQCVARAPGGPMHVLVDDRLAEHVPGCNLAVRREALLAIGGFDPIYVRAGDDVDVCWRLQARGWQVGFAPAALVWHRHRASIKAFWRQQVGYGEGQAWLIPHHPDKFVGRKIKWAGSIYSPLPFIRSQSRQRVHTGVWGTAPFPSIYQQRSVYSLALLPHSVRWQASAAILIAVGATAALLDRAQTALWLVAGGTAGLAITVILCIWHAVTSDIEAVPLLAGHSRAGSRFAQRALIAWLHLVQPFARAFGEVRGRLFLPFGRPVLEPRRPSTPLGAPADWWDAIRLWAGRFDESSFWSERWVSTDGLLTRIAELLRKSHLARFEFDDGWQHRRDISVAIGRWAWVDLRMLVEEHAGGKCLVRIARRLRPSRLPILAGCSVALWVLLAYFASDLFEANSFGKAGWVFGTALTATAVWKTRRTVALIERAVGEVVNELDLLPLQATLSARTRVTGIASPKTAARATTVGGVSSSQGASPKRDGPPATAMRERPGRYVAESVPASHPSKMSKLPSGGAMLAAPLEAGRVPRRDNGDSRTGTQR
jgi:O-antigen biosynthesis protein